MDPYIVISNQPLILWEIDSEKKYAYGLSPKINSEAQSCIKIKDIKDVYRYLEGRGRDIQIIDWDFFKSNGYMEILAEMNSVYFWEYKSNEARMPDITYHTLVDLDNPKLLKVKRFLKIEIIQKS